MDFNVFSFDTADTLRGMLQTQMVTYNVTSIFSDGIFLLRNLQNDNPPFFILFLLFDIGIYIQLAKYEMMP